jgi:lysophospholipase L1-like esterase
VSAGRAHPGTASQGPAGVPPAAPGGAGLERALTWRGLAWVVARQHRTALIGCGVLYAVAAVLLAVNGVQMHASYRALGLARCPRPARSLACLAGIEQFNQDYVVWVRLIPLLLLAVPALAGAFTGAPVLGQDLDHGTFRFAWTQGAGRARLLSAKLVLLGGPLLLAGAGLAALASWWFSPQYALGNGRLAPQLFVPLGPSFAAWTLLAFALGVAAGAALRRVVPAIAATLAAWTGLAVVTGIWLRYHLYAAPSRFTFSFAQASQQTQQTQVGLPHRVRIFDGSPPRAFVLNTWLVNAKGQVVTRPPRPPSGATAAARAHGGAGPLAVLHGFHLAGVYLPDSRFWPFQWIEAGWLAVLSALLLAVPFWLSRRPHPLRAGSRLMLGWMGRATPRFPGMTSPAGAAMAGSQAGPAAVITRPADGTVVTGAESGTVPVERDLTWPGVAWVAWRQHRTALSGCAALFGAAALLLLINGLAMRALYHRLGLSGCAVQNLTPACAGTVKQFQQNFGIWTGLIPVLLLVVPVTAGTFTGAAVVAREIERGTFRFAWTQGCGRLRLLIGKIAVLAAALLLGGGTVAALASWWFSPLNALGYARLYPQYFAIQGPAFPAWTLLAFALAVVAGSLIRRVAAAVGTALAVCAGLAIPAGMVLRYRFYRPPVQVTASLGQTSFTLPPRSVPTGTWWVGNGGKVLPQTQVEHAIASLSPDSLAHWFLTHDPRLVVTYQPDSRFWPFQWTETVWLVVVSVLLLAAALGLARQRAPGRTALAWLVLAAVALAGGASAGGYRLAAADSSRPVPAATSPTPPASPVQNTNGPGYLALGDSIAFGYRPGDVTSAAQYLNPANFTGYPEDVAKALGLDAANASCPGETSASLINPDAPSNGCETSGDGSPGYRSLPLHVSYTGSQLGYAVSYLRKHPDTRLVTIDIGANDMFRCQYTTADHCTGADFGQALASVTQNLDTILNALRNQAHYRHDLVVLTYYALNYGNRTSVTQTQELNAALTGPAARYGARLADGFGAFRAASARSGGDTCAAGLRIRLPSGSCDEHPSAHGQQVLAAAVQRAIGRNP